MVTIDTAGGERARVALLPFCSPRYSVRAAELMELDAAAAAGEYADRLAAIVGALCADAEPGAVNLLVAHCMVRGGVTGGGERDAQTAFEPYWLSAAAFPPSLAYGALGHLHLAQRVPSGAPVWYSGSPVQVDFGEAGAGKHVLVVDVTATTPAQVREVPLRAGTELRTVTGTIAELEAMAGDRPRRRVDPRPGGGTGPRRAGRRRPDVARRPGGGGAGARRPRPGGHRAWRPGRAGPRTSSSTRTWPSRRSTIPGSATLFAELLDAETSA